MKKLISLFTLVMLSSFSLSAFAQNKETVSEETAEEKPPVELFDTYRNLYHVQINEHGAILKSEEADELMFIGKDCDVSSPKHGKGKWKYSDAGIMVQFLERRFIFGRQKLPIPNSGKCKMNL